MTVYKFLFVCEDLIKTYANEKVKEVLREVEEELSKNRETDKYPKCCVRAMKDTIATHRQIIAKLRGKQ